jgi:hypothetical protein
MGIEWVAKPIQVAKHGVAAERVLQESASYLFWLAADLTRGGDHFSGAIWKKLIKKVVKGLAKSLG